MASDSADGIRARGDVSKEIVREHDCTLMREERYFAAVSDSLNVFSTTSVVGNDTEKALQVSASCPERQISNFPSSVNKLTDNENSSIYETLNTENEKLVLLGIEIEEDDSATISSQELTTKKMAAADNIKSQSDPDKITTKPKRRPRNTVKKKTKDGVFSSAKSKAPSRSRLKKDTVTLDTVRCLLKAQNDSVSSLEQNVREPGALSLGNGIVFKVQECEFPFNQKVSLDIIRMDVNDLKFQYIMIYKDLFTNYILLRPLVFNYTVLEVSLELFKIFADFGIPNTVEVNALYASTLSNAINNLQKSFNISKISISSQENISEEGKNVKKRLLKWSNIEKSSHWATGCYVIQQYLNKKITINDPFSPYVKVFGKNRAMTELQQDLVANNKKPCQNVERNLNTSATEITSLVVENELKLNINNSSDKIESQNVPEKYPNHQKENTYVEAITDSPILTIEIDEDSVDTILDLDVQSNSNSILKNLLLQDTAKEISSQSPNTNSNRNYFKCKRKRRTRTLNCVEKKRKIISNKTKNKTKAQLQPLMSFESFSGLDEVLYKLRKCEKCTEMTEGVICLNCNTKTKNKTDESTHSHVTRSRRKKSRVVFNR